MKMTNQLKLVALYYYEKMEHGSMEQFHPMQDGIVRVVDLRTKRGVYLRPVLNIYPLEECYVDDIPQSGGNVTGST